MPLVGCHWHGEIPTPYSNCREPSTLLAIVALELDIGFRSSFRWGSNIPIEWLGQLLYDVLGKIADHHQSLILAMRSSGRRSMSLSSLGFTTLLLFVVTLCVLATSTTLQAQAEMDPDFYRSSCSRAGILVLSAVNLALNRRAKSVASVLRIFFHDCFVHVRTLISWYSAWVCLYISGQYIDRHCTRFHSGWSNPIPLWTSTYSLRAHMHLVASQVSSYKLMGSSGNVYRDAMQQCSWTRLSPRNLRRPTTTYRGSRSSMRPRPQWRSTALACAMRRHPRMATQLRITKVLRLPGYDRICKISHLWHSSHTMDQIWQCSNLHLATLISYRTQFLIDNEANRCPCLGMLSQSYIANHTGWSMALSFLAGYSQYVPSVMWCVSACSCPEEGLPTECRWAAGTEWFRRPPTSPAGSSNSTPPWPRSRPCSAPSACPAKTWWCCRAHTMCGRPVAVQNHLTTLPPDATLDATYAAVLYKQCLGGI